MEANSIVKLCRQRELQEQLCVKFQRKLHVTDNLISRLGLEFELQGHTGCVNCLEWNEHGNLLASGSDDQQVIIWDPLHHKKLHAIQTGHHGNIFSVKFLPNSNDATVISGAADFKIRIHDIHSKETTHVCGCHVGRVKRLATIPNLPFMFWSAAEDGMIMQFDLRTPHVCARMFNNVLINLTNHAGKNAEAKCLAINPLRPELLAVGANDPYIRVYDRRMITPTSVQPSLDHHPRTRWDRQNGNSLLAGENGCDDNLPPSCVQYFVAGHLPLKHLDYKKRYRSLASTYLTFSPDGSELLVNLGGEQIYLFDINKQMPIKNFDFEQFAMFSGVCKETNGFNSHRNGTTQNGITNGVTRPLTTCSQMPIVHEFKDAPRRLQRGTKLLPSKAEILKQRANAVFEKQQYSLAISLYNKALQIAPDSAVLYGNRAAGYMKRSWDGDLYAALRDCHRALELDPDHLKAHFRLARCLFELQWTKEADECLRHFKSKFPDHAQSHMCEALDRDIKAAMCARTEPSCDDGHVDVGGSVGTSENRRNRKPQMSEQERQWRLKACDYENRFCGHCNTTTDIKETNFFGSNSQYVIAGSDDGSFFIWDRFTTNIVRVLKGDEAIVNCLQPNPDFCLLATSGIDPVVRLWSPRPQDGRHDDREVIDSDDAALANQKRMNADPLEMMLMNMGYRIRSVFETDDDNEAPDTPEVQCRPS